MKKQIIVLVSILFIAAVAYASSATIQSPQVAPRTIDKLADNATLEAATLTSDNDTLTSGVIWIGKCSGKIGLWIDVEKRGSIEPCVRVEISPGITETTFSTDSITTRLTNIKSGRIEHVEIDAPLSEFIKVVAINDGPGVAKITMYSFIK